MTSTKTNHRSYDNTITISPVTRESCTVFRVKLHLCIGPTCNMNLLQAASDSKGCFIAVGKQSLVLHKDPIVLMAVENPSTCRVYTLMIFSGSLNPSF